MFDFNFPLIYSFYTVGAALVIHLYSINFMGRAKKIVKLIALVCYLCTLGLWLLAWILESDIARKLDAGG